MATLLLIETSTNVCSVVLAIDGSIVFSKTNSDGMNHAELLSPYIDEAIQEMSKHRPKPDAVVVSGGPGSYTGLRIGVSTAKGLCYGWEVPLISVNTLRVIFDAALSTIHPTEPACFCPMIDARRMEVYCCMFDREGNQISDVRAEIVTEDSFRELLDEQKVYFFGNGAAKCMQTINHPNAVFIDNIVPEAQYMLGAAIQQFNHNEFQDVAYFEPFYLKEFQATTPKNKVL